MNILYVFGVSIWPLYLRFFYYILALFRQYGNHSFPFYWEQVTLVFSVVLLCVFTFSVVMSVTISATTKNDYYY
jgi:hypothetical protein